MRPLESILVELQDWVRGHFPQRIARRLRVELDDGDEVKLPVPLPPHTSPALLTVTPEVPPFIPNATQELILEALDGKALRADNLAHEVGGRSSLYRKPKGGIQELRDEGLVDLHPRLGYYRKDSPPEELVSSQVQ